jgi:hypothetical protein
MMAIFNEDMVDLAGKNTFWQKEVYRAIRRFKSFS